MTNPATISILAPAKVNLCLDVLPPRPDGYHPVRSVMQAIDLYDRLQVVPDPLALRLECDVLELATPDNLVYRAAQLLRARFQVEAGAVLTLEKRIPAGAGLGGGSSDAAAALIALNELWHLGRRTSELVPLAAALGADVPFFLHGGACLAEGIGEILTPLNPRLRYALLLVKPSFPIETRWAYQAVDAYPAPEHPDPYAVRQALEESDLSALGAALGNTMEAPVFAAHPQLRRWKALLLAAGAAGALMSGSGSTLFGLFPTRARAEKAGRELRRQAFDDVWTRVAEPLSGSSG